MSLRIDSVNEGITTITEQQEVSEISTESRTGKVADGKIFVSDVSEVIKIRTGERVNFTA